MIQIESILIRELRGIRDLELAPSRKNFVVSGPNGSGKSGVVDAIQFALTGEISRLSGKGTGGLSVQRHGPHVDRRDDPAAAEVSLRLYAPTQNKSVVLTRNVKTAKSFRLEPDDPEIRAIIEEVAKHPELSLSRREIIRYILVEAGQRSKQIQALLRLEQIGETRGVLKTARNKLSISLTTALRDVENAEDAFRRHLDVKHLKEEGILAVVNPRRLTLGLPEIKHLDAGTDLGAGVLDGTAQPGFNKESALRDVEALESATAQFHSLGAAEASSLIADLDTLESDPALLTAITRRSFIERGIALVEGSQCPLCDAAWEDEEALRAHLQDKLRKVDKAKGVQNRLLDSGSEIASHARRISGLVDSVQSLAKSNAPAGFSDVMEQWAAGLQAFASELDTVEKITRHRGRLDAGWPEAPPSLTQDLGALKEATPSETGSECSGRSSNVSDPCTGSPRHPTGNCAGNRGGAAKAVEVGKVVYRTYCEVADAYLSALYEAVEDDFGAYYRELNADDEGGFKAKLEPAEGGLDLEVAFYDKGMFPPGAYHSEGHQDGMGVCLYLALMKRLLGDRFSFAVLDDVVMSVDQGHRKEFCRLLKTRFPHTQFIITTHDRVWAKQMQTEGLVEAKGGVAFHSWSVETGPIAEQESGVWDRIEADVAKGDMDVAAGRLRRHMEYVAGELADALGAKPTYRGDLSYDLGDLLPAVTGRYGELLKRAANAANGWNDEAARIRVQELRAAWSEALVSYGGENWAVNKAIHYNEWANFTKTEFQEVVGAFRGLLTQLRCARSDCESWLYVAPKKGDPEGLRCRCGAVSINLKAK